MAKNKTKQISVTNKNTGKTSELQGPISSTYGTETDKKNSLPALPNEIKSTIEKPQETIEELVQCFLNGKIKSLPNDRIKKLKKHIFEVEFSQEFLAEAVKNDPALEKAKSLLLMLDKHKTYPVFQTSISKFIREVIAQHPIMVSHNINAWLPLEGAAEELGLIKLFEEVSPPKNIAVSIDEKTDKKVESDLQRSRLNLFYIALIWRLQKNFINFNEFIRSLRATVFASKLTSLEIEHSCVEFFTESNNKDISKISALMDWYAKESEDNNKSARLANENAAKLDLQIINANQKISTLQNTSNTQLNKINRLTTEIAEIKEAKRVALSHTDADQSLERERAIRLMASEIKILEECKAALQKNPPKAAVANELISNVIKRLQAELLNLRG